MSTVCVINDLGLPLGGQTTIALATVEGMHARGFDVVYVCGAEQVTPMLAERNIRCIKLDQEELIKAKDRKRAALNGIWNRRAHDVIRKLTTELPPDTVFHVHGWSRILSPSIFSALRPVMDRVVLTMHDHFSFCPNGGYFNFKTGQICTLKPLSVSCALTDCDSRNRGFKAYRYVKHASARVFAGFPQNLRNFIVFSEAQRAMSRGFLHRDARFFVLENPVAAAPAERIQAEHNQDIVFIGRLSAEKGAEIYAKACTLLGIAPQLVGEGERRAAVMAAAPDAQITGWVDKEEVGRRFARARAIVFPSVWPETFGLSMFEAISRGIPAIVSDAVLMKDKVLELGGGVSFKSGDAADLAQKIAAMADDETIRALSVAGFTKYRETPFTNSRYLDGLTDIYRALGGRVPERIAA